MEPNTQIQVGLIPSQQLISLLTDDEGNWRDVPEGQSVVPLVKIPKPEGAWEPNVVWFADRVERQWVAGTPAPAPSYTAEAWLAAQSYTPLRLLTCLDIEAKLAAAAKVSPKLASVRQWLDTITLLAAPAPDAQRSDWTACPHSFAEASQEALQVLSS